MTTITDLDCPSGKIMFLSRHLANQAAVRLSRRNRRRSSHRYSRRAEAYRCPVCPGFHLRADYDDRW